MTMACNVPCPELLAMGTDSGLRHSCGRILPPRGGILAAAKQLVATSPGARDPIQFFICPNHHGQGCSRSPVIETLSHTLIIYVADSWASSFLAFRRASQELRPTMTRAKSVDDS